MADLLGVDVGRYHIVEQLGEGGMAAVYKAYDTRLERDVAIKFIRREVFSPLVVEHMLKRFEREAKALGRLNHPNIVGVHDYGEHEGSPYLVMTYIPGGTLKDLAGKPMPAGAAARLLAPVAQALEYAHEQNVVHRDIKPANILLTAKGQPMLSDFGIAKILEAGETTLTGTGVGVGTPEYMSPEQGKGEEVDHRTDIYALGVVLYELLTGRKPYMANTPIAVVMKHCSDPLPPLRQYAQGVPEEAEKLVYKAMAKDPANRFQTMAEMAEALEKLVGWVSISTPIIVNRINPEQVRVVPTAEIPVPQVEITIDQLAPKPSPVKPDLRGEKSPPAAADGAKQRKFGGAARVGLGLLAGGGLMGLFIGLGGTGIFAGPTAGIMSPPVLSAAAAVSTAAQPTANLTPALTQIPLPTAAPSATHLPTVIPTPTSTPTASPSPTPTLGIGSTRVSEKDGMVMVYVPEGEFLMGYEKGDIQERPVHKVFLDAYWIDRTEVTNAMYALCVKAGVCKEPIEKSSPSRHNYYIDSKYSDYPVNHMDWERANSYCKWAGRRLPTEAEWEKAARGTDGRLYPWGDIPPDCSTANFDCGTDRIMDTNKVGSYPKGASPYGALDLAGNVLELTADFYNVYYYSGSPVRNPQNLVASVSHAYRGGAYYTGINYLRSSSRDIMDALKWGGSTTRYFSGVKMNWFDGNNYVIGFRCAQ